MSHIEKEKENLPLQKCVNQEAAGVWQKLLMALPQVLKHGYIFFFTRPTSYALI